MMRITNLADYAVILMCRLAQSNGTPYSAGNLSEETRIPVPTVSKILGTLSRANLLQSQRGLKGGFFLARPSVQISVADIIEAIDGPISLTACAGEGDDDCDYKAGCSMHPYWMSINAAVRGALSGISLEHISRLPSAEEFLQSLSQFDKTALSA